MTNADKFKNIFGLYATELWSMPEKDFLKWLNSEAVSCSEIPNNCPPYCHGGGSGYDQEVIFSHTSVTSVEILTKEVHHGAITVDVVWKEVILNDT